MQNIARDRGGGEGERGSTRVCRKEGGEGERGRSESRVKERKGKEGVTMSSLPCLVRPNQIHNKDN